ncbi:MAG: response regulator [Gelidibacter sp.]|nr:response regulator [Gelidibacter sp.]
MGKKILIIEDDTMLLNTLSNLLTEEGYKVKGCSNADNTFAYLEEEKPDLIMTDLVIHGTDGFDILKILSEKTEFKKIPTIVLTNLNDDEHIKRAKSYGIKNYIIKAENSLADIVDKVKKVFN